eukprot:TRINITY_DN1048_c0_g1_i1.p3 TRINITY_DN1048_c0_g1~~TRINITY_DN1048_c0_g1_i1.p3  ORF type:complete len:141 (+),score=28.02 TRINITY_DN1048_c0_g1_i1:124-546(+)
MAPPKGLCVVAAALTVVLVAASMAAAQIPGGRPDNVPDLLIDGPTLPNRGGPLSRPFPAAAAPSTRAAFVSKLVRCYYSVVVYGGTRASSECRRLRRRRRRGCWRCVVTKWRRCRVKAPRFCFLASAAVSPEAVGGGGGV